MTKTVLCKPVFILKRWKLVAIQTPDTCTNPNFLPDVTMAFQQPELTNPVEIGVGPE